MIFTAVLVAILFLLNAVLGLLPDLPDMPQIIIDYSSWILEYISNGADLVVAVIGQAFLNAILLVIVLLFTYEQVYHLIIWVIRKIPVISVH